jgi:hypothetical protein
VLEYVKSREKTTRGELLLRFSLDDEAQVRAVVHDLCESQLVVASDEGPNVSYRSASEEELLDLRKNGGAEGQDDLLVAVMYREGPLTLAEIAARAQVDVSRIESAIWGLVETGRIQHLKDADADRFEARALIVPLGSAVGWEAAVLDHYKAMVRTVLIRLSQKQTSALEDSAGGSTYTIDIWPGHPMEEEVRGSLKQVRSNLSGLRTRVAAYNESQERPQHYSRVVFYTGQSLINEQDEEPTDEEPQDGA